MEHSSISAIAKRPSAPYQKGLGLWTPGHPLQSIAELGWNLLHEDLSLPAAILYKAKLVHNLAWMKDFIQAYGVKLAPHGKTTMAPRLFDMQMESGAWAITLATPHQTAIAYQHGIRRVLMANQLVGRQNMQIISTLLEDADFEYFCLIDSVEITNQLGAFFRERGQRLNVLIELGVTGGRTGVRNTEQLDQIIATLSLWRDSIALSGVEIYEGILDDETAIRALLKQSIDTARLLADRGLFARSPAILSGAGSAWYDIVADVLSHADIGMPVDVVLRPGCYLTSDAGIYKTAQANIMQRNPIARQMSSSLEPALHLWAYVQSIPEHGKAIVGLGKRDSAFDAGLPTPALHYRPGQKIPIKAPSQWKLTKMMDQHAYMQISERDDIQVGDMIGFDISHPCLTFDKWKHLAIVDEQYQIVEVIETFF